MAQAKSKFNKFIKSRARSKKRFRLDLKKIFKDQVFRWFVWTAILLSLVTLGLLFFRVRAVEYAVPLRYSSFQGFDGLGAWYRIYIFGAFNLLVTAGNLSLAAMSYDRSRITSFYLVMGTVVINLFLLIIILTLTANLEV